MRQSEPNSGVNVALRRACELHVTGNANFVDDEPPPHGMLHAAVFYSPVAHARITGVDTADAERVPGVVAVLQFSDIPGNGYLGSVIQDEPLLAFDELMYVGQPIALVVAKDSATARSAARLTQLSFESLPHVTCPRRAFLEGHTFEQTRVLSKGDVESAWSRCDVVVDGSVDLGGQEHLYLETHRARAIPLEGGYIKVNSSTQHPSGVQKSVAEVLGIPLHKVEVDVRRIGGGFGGKEDQATHWACMASLAAHRLNRPVQLILSRGDDLRMTGKRHPYLQDYKIGLTESGKILAYQVDHYQNAGAFLDLSTAVLGRTILHSTGAYAIENVRIHATSCRTNLPPNTAFRGFGVPQAIFVLEAAIYRAARKMNVSPDWIQERNLVDAGYVFPYGQTLEDPTLRRTWFEADRSFRLSELRASTVAFNQQNAGQKKGYAVMPVCYGIGFTQTMLNQGNSLVHVHLDGSVSVATGGVEMGQGVNANLSLIAAKTLGIRPERIHVNSTNTSRVANSSASAASSTTDLNGEATIQACQQILRSLKSIAANCLHVEASRIELANERVTVDGKPVELAWEALVSESYASRTALMAHGYYAPTGIHLDRETGHGNPFLYFVFGTAIIAVTVDCLRGTYTLDSVKLVHDAGRSLIPGVDQGQIEGGLAQGIGWVTVEDLAYDGDGRLMSDSLSTYKIPNADLLPDEIDVRFLADSRNSHGPFGCKAVGEPPLIYGIATYFAIRRAVDAFREQQSCRAGDESNRDQTPLTPERVLLSLYPEFASSDNADVAVAPALRSTKRGTW